ncbi:MAG: hypothetical protein RIC36_08765 [Rhodospirillales bacterium]
MHTVLKALSRLAGVAVFAVSTSAFAAPDCTCRYQGADFNVGSCTCITISGEAKRACCGRVLNNTSWDFNAGQCPVSAVPPSSSPATRTADAGVDIQQQAALPQGRITAESGASGQ